MSVANSALLALVRKYEKTALMAKLASSLPDAGEVKEAFAELFYAPKSRPTNAQKRRSRKHFTSYVLLRFAQEANALPLAQDLTPWRIEHVRPQSLSSGEVSSPEYSIGNLTLLTSGANGELDDGDLAAKRAVLKAYVPWEDVELTRWTEDDTKAEATSIDIAKRAEVLADLAVDTAWAIS